MPGYLHININLYFLQVYTNHITHIIIEHNKRKKRKKEKKKKKQQNKKKRKNPSHVINFNEPELLTAANHPRKTANKRNSTYPTATTLINVDESSKPLFVFYN